MLESDWLINIISHSSSFIFSCLSCLPVWSPRRLWCDCPDPRPAPPQPPQLWWAGSSSLVVPRPLHIGRHGRSSAEIIYSNFTILSNYVNLMITRLTKNCWIYFSCDDRQNFFGYFSKLLIVGVAGEAAVWLMWLVWLM